MQNPGQPGFWVGGPPHGDAGFAHGHGGRGDRATTASSSQPWAVSWLCGAWLRPWRQFSCPFKRAEAAGGTVTSNKIPLPLRVHMVRRRHAEGNSARWNSLICALRLPQPPVAPPYARLLEGKPKGGRRRVGGERRRILLSSLYSCGALRWLCAGRTLRKITSKACHASAAD